MEGAFTAQEKYTKSCVASLIQHAMDSAVNAEIAWSMSSGIDAIGIGREGNNMAEYHVGCGIAGIYAGTLKKSGNEWRNKSDVTHEAMCAVAQYLIDHKKELRFTLSGGKKYVLRVIEEGDEDDN